MGIEALAGHEASRLKAPIRGMDDSEDGCEWHGLYRRPGDASRQKVRRTKSVELLLSQDLRADPTRPVAAGAGIEPIDFEPEADFPTHASSGNSISTRLLL
jgi:hypothetical protein